MTKHAIPRNALVEPVAELPTSRKTDWSEVTDQVAAQDGWCLLAGDFDPSQATHLRNGRVAGYDPEVFEVSTRRIPLEETDGRRRVRIYMRKR